MRAAKASLSIRVPLTASKQAGNSQWGERTLFTNTAAVTIGVPPVEREHSASVETGQETTSSERGARTLFTSSLR